MNDEVLGVRRALRHVKLLWTQRFLQVLPTMRESFQQRRKNARRKLKQHKSLLQSVNATAVRPLLEEYAPDFAFQFQHLVQGHRPADLEKQSVTSFQSLSRHHYPTQEHGKNFEEECASMPFESGFGGDWFIPLTELRSTDHLGNPGQVLGDNLARKLMGVSAFQRAMQVFEYMLLARDFSHFTDDEVFNMAVNMRAANFFPSNEVP